MRRPKSKPAVDPVASLRRKRLSRRDVEISNRIEAIRVRLMDISKTRTRHKKAIARQEYAVNKLDAEEGELREEVIELAREFLDRPA